MTITEKAAFFSVAGSGTAVIASLWFVMATISNGEAWQGSVVLFLLAYMAKSEAYWTLAKSTLQTGARH